MGKSGVVASLLAACHRLNTNEHQVCSFNIFLLSYHFLIIFFLIIVVFGDLFCSVVKHSLVLYAWKMSPLDALFLEYYFLIIIFTARINLTGIGQVGLECIQLGHWFSRQFLDFQLYVSFFFFSFLSWLFGSMHDFVFLFWSFCVLWYMLYRISSMRLFRVWHLWKKINSLTLQRTLAGPGLLKLFLIQKLPGNKNVNWLSSMYTYTVLWWKIKNNCISRQTLQYIKKFYNFYWF